MNRKTAMIIVALILIVSGGGLIAADAFLLKSGESDFHPLRLAGMLDSLAGVMLLLYALINVK